MSLIEILIGRREFQAQSKLIDGGNLEISTKIFEHPELNKPLLIEPESFKNIYEARKSLQLRKFINLAASMFSAAFASAVISGSSNEIKAGRDFDTNDMIFIALGGLSLRLAFNFIQEAKKSNIALESLDRSRKD